MNLFGWCVVLYGIVFFDNVKGWKSYILCRSSCTVYLILLVLE